MGGIHVDCQDGGSGETLEDATAYRAGAAAEVEHA